MDSKVKGNSGRLVVAIDLMPLRPGGENGGIKPAIFALLAAVRNEANNNLVFIFLTNSASHDEVRRLAGPDDLLLCLLEQSPHSCDKFEARPNEFRVIPPPPDLVRAIGADLLYCPFGATTLHVSGIPTIALIADVLHKDYPFTLTETQIAEREAYLQRTLRDAAMVQCISQSGMNQVMKHYAFPRHRLFVTYLPIHSRLERAHDGVESPVRALPAAPFFFYPANLWLHKNHEVLLLSYARYCQSREKEIWDLVLTFHEEGRAAYLKSVAATLGIAKHVHFLGFVDDAQLHQIWSRAGALVFPSLHEGFGIPLLEAMHYGVPIIAGEEFALKEVAADARYPIDPRNPISLSTALAEVSRNEALRRELVRVGRQRLDLFDVKAAASALLNAFRSTMGKERALPRKPPYCSIPPLVSAPTPGSAHRWDIDIHFQTSDSTQECSVYLDDLPFASFAPAACKEQTFSFACRPEGRTLALRRNPSHNSNGGTGLCVRRIVARRSRDTRILLYENPLHEG